MSVHYFTLNIWIAMVQCVLLHTAFSRHHFIRIPTFDFEASAAFQSIRHFDPEISPVLKLHKLHRTKAFLVGIQVVLMHKNGEVMRK